MILEIKFDKGEGLNLYVDGQSEHFFFNYEKRVSALRKANERFDQDLMSAASLHPQDDKGAFLWCYTSEFIRGENISGLLKLYYLLELIKVLSLKVEDKPVRLNYYIPNDVYHELKSYGFKPIKTIAYYQGVIREWLKVGYHSFNSAKKNVVSFFKCKNIYHQGNLLDVNQSPTNNRLDEISNYAFFKPYKVFSGQEHSITGFEKRDIVVFRNENTFGDGLACLIKSVALSLFIRKNKSKLPQVYRSFFRCRDIFSLWSLLLYQRGAKNYFSRNKIYHLVHVSTLTKPEYRILWSESKKFYIKTGLIASRTLKKLSSSERLIEADIKGFSRTTLPDYFVVRDQFSKDVFKGFKLYDNADIGGRFSPVKKLNSQILLKETVLYIVLTHIKECSDYLLKELSRVDFKKYQIDKFFFRCHPSVRYSKDEISSYFQGHIIIDHTGMPINECNYAKIVMISGPTTGALELIKKGVLLFWLPYIWKDGILFDDIMNMCGVKCDSIKDLIKKISASQASTKKELNCFEAFNNRELISSRIKKFEFW